MLPSVWKPHASAKMYTKQKQKTIKFLLKKKRKGIQNKYDWSIHIKLVAIRSQLVWSAKSTV